MKLMVDSAALREKGQFEVWDDFSYYTDANNNWTKAVGSGGGVAITAGAGGLL